MHDPTCPGLILLHVIHSYIVYLCIKFRKEKKHISISAKKEASVNFLTDPVKERSTLRPTDLLVFGWARGKHACVELTGVSTLVGLRENVFIAGQAAKKAESKKLDKHAKTCAEN
ncbi:hypothetical protein Hanom_Chr06g00510971 [Helianthus anomalus]